jgi:hypothetical protein
MELNHYSGGFIFVKFKDKWYALIVKDRRYNEPKAAGGMSEGLESPEATVLREMMQELGISVVDIVQVHEVQVNDVHSQYFFLVTKANNLPSLDEKRMLKEIKGGKPGDELEMSWITLEQFAQCIYWRQTDAFNKAVVKMAELDRDFCIDNMKILQRIQTS